MDLALWIIVAALVVVGFVSYFIFATFAVGAGFSPTPPEVADVMLQFARVRPEDRVVDLGAGTGSLVLRAAEVYGAQTLAVEIEPIRYLLLRFRCGRSAARDRLSAVRADLFQVDLHGASVVLAFLWPSTMRRLKEKLGKELPPGARVVSYYHPIPGWIPFAVHRGLRVYAYQQPFPEGKGDGTEPTGGSLLQRHGAGPDGIQPGRGPGREAGLPALDRDSLVPVRGDRDLNRSWGVRFPPREFPPPSGMEARARPWGPGS